MIYELRTYTCKPGTTPKVVQMFADSIHHRTKYSPLLGFWTTEIGPLNQVVHLWPYKDLEDRGRVRASFAKDPNWPPPIHEHLTDMASDVIVPFPYSPDIKPGKMGPIYEMRYYILQPGAVPKVRDLWAEKFPGRHKLAPNLLVGTTEFGELNKLIHIWPYSSLEHRAQTRAKATAEGIWPPNTAPYFLSMKNKILLPASFSPLQ